MTFDEIIVRSYLLLFGRRFMQPVNRLTHRLSIRALGYNNEGNGLSDSGEGYFIEKLAAYAPQLCLDVGASWGGYSRRILKNTSAQVFAFEPQPESFKKAVKIEAEFPGRVKVEQLALGEKKQTLKLYHGPKSGLATLAPEVNAIDYVGANNVETTEVPVVTLDGYYDRNLKGKFQQLDFLKIDTEGFEYEVLRGARKMFKTLPPRFVQIEFNMHHAFRGHPMTKFADLFPGYRLYQLLPFRRGMVERNPRSSEVNIYEYSNFIFVRGDTKVSLA